MGTYTSSILLDGNKGIPGVTVSILLPAGYGWDTTATERLTAPQMLG